MTLLIKQSEATASLRRLLFVLVDATDGFTKETGLSADFTIEISKAGAAQGAGAGSITEIGDGQYYYEFTAAEVNTLGFLAVSIRHANCRDADGEVQVIDFANFKATGFSTHVAADIWTAGSRALTTPNDYKADVTNLDAAITSRAPINEYDTELAAIQTDLDNPAQYKATGFSTHIPADIWSVVTRALTDKAGFTISGTKQTLDALNDILASDVWSAGSRELSTPNNYKADVSALALEATVNALNNLSSANIQTILENNDLDHLIQVAAGVEKPTVDSYLDQIMNKAGTQDFDPTTDSLEAIRDRGDTHWITGGAGGIDAIINVIPSIPKNIDLSNTKTVRIALYLIDSIDDLPSTAEITPGTITIDRSADGGTSWSTIVNAAACSEHAGCIYYDEVFDSGTGYASADMIKITFKSQKVTIAANDFEITDPTNGMVFTTRIDSGLSGGGPSAGDIADAVWNEPIVDHTNNAQFGGKNQKVVPSETIGDYKASGFSTHNATAIWAEAVKVITGGVLTTPADYKADVSALALEATVNALNNLSATEVNTEVDSALNTAIPTSPIANSINERIKQIDENPDTYKASGFSTHNPAAVWTETGRELSTPANYKANVSGLAPANEYDTELTAIQADLDNPAQYKDKADVSALATSVALTTHDGKLDVVDSNVNNLLGLSDENSYIDNYTFDSGKMKGCRKRIYDSKANAISHGATGLIATYTITVSWSGNDILSYLAVKD